MANNKGKNKPIFICFNNHVKQNIVENKAGNYVLNGVKNNYFKYVNDRYIGSPTNSAINNGYCRLIYGKGLAIRNQKENLTNYAKLKSVLSKKDIKNIIKDFQIQGMAYIQVIKSKGNTLNKLSHISVDKIAPEIENLDREIKNYYFSNDWSKPNKEENKPIKIPAFGTSKEGREIYAIKPYQMGKDYFSLPTYQSGLQYAELEEEISNFLISHMKNGMSAGYIVNVPDSYNLDDDKKDEIERKVRQQLTGSNNAGKFIINFQQGEKPITVEVIEINDAHDKWQFSSTEAQNKILISHEVVSPLLFGVKDANGFSSNADELDVAEAQTLKRVIQPKQDEIIDSLEEILYYYGINVNLYFKPLTEEKETIIETQNTELSKQNNINDPKPERADYLISLGEEIPDNWVELENRTVNEHSLTEEKLNNIFQLARLPIDSPKAKSEQDTSLFKIRYQYKGNPNPQREFCRKLIKANKVYTKEALEKASKQPVNKGFGVNGSDTYDIFLYKGGVNCKHFWERKIFLKSNNENISVNQARKMILELDPKERKNAMWEKNPKEVAQIASPSNNFWKK